MVDIDVFRTALPLDLLAGVEALASSQHRSREDVLRDAVGDYIRAHKLVGPVNEACQNDRKLQALEARRRILELRKKNQLPSGVTIEDLLSHGRK